jgi:hypothetical protein
MFMYTHAFCECTGMLSKHIYVYICVYIHNKYVCMYIYTYICTYTRTKICLLRNAHLYIHIYVYVCMYVYMYIYMSINM